MKWLFAVPFVLASPAAIAADPAPAPVIAPAPAATPAMVPAVASKSGAAKKDPNREICRTEETPGSRLATTRRCMPAYQWIQYDRAMRDSVDHAQRGTIPPGISR
jgi:hypothetical protein